MVFSALFCPILGASQGGSLDGIKEINGLVRVTDIDPTIVIDLKYATPDNFTGQKIYVEDVCVLRRETAEKLASANAQAKALGLRIKIWDAFRPLSAQKVLWSYCPDSRYVADPEAGGSRHNRGGAVDITLVGKDGRELEMPSGFDDFTELASVHHSQMTEQANKNLALLQSVMVAHGFQVYEHEWWHFEDCETQNFPLVDISLAPFLHYELPQPEALCHLDPSIHQAVVAEVVSDDFSMAYVSLWERQSGGWRLCSPLWQAGIGEQGIAPPGTKREGDGKTPLGIFSLHRAFGYADAATTGLAYRQAKEDDFWVDDPNSPFYNQWVTGDPSADSFEVLQRSDHLYKWGIVIEYNTDPIVPGDGSAIFMHLWRQPGGVTAGCIALAEENLCWLIGQLNINSNPVIAITNTL